MAAILNLTTSVTEVIRRNAINNVANQDLHLVAHLLGSVRKTKTYDQRGSVETLRFILSTRVQLQVDQKKEVFSNPLLDIGSGEVELHPNASNSHTISVLLFRRKRNWDSRMYCRIISGFGVLLLHQKKC
ncbi:hypothetical protein TNCV_1041941 [Trichonephila clavipes]|nr:hypothetical protein TNCV_1041941 [Trichonephila clavipes]